ncbi:hypothetical protein SAPIO_CDS3463 [Scedosporium apiospermum]|uniref:Apurinic-apyrimidinic endonuclease 1 n=1 Tax=Pseudallescheria apiosperma TaxID=563466 RepID=A0A084GAU5_PSEDA|nr:uncharacterized protein SAPIO_CDS3463 [Scedosporium apiospermum]KEZ44457.1 hypothetical protein SAPIO_CDS3463 [Scedosporium apiospermum]
MCPTTRKRVVTRQDNKATNKSTAKGATASKRKVEDSEEEEYESDEYGNGSSEEEDNKTTKRRKVAAKPAATATKTKAKRALKKKNGEDNTPLAARTAVTSLKKAMYIGAHVSAAGGVQNSIQNALHIGANAFALFLKSQRKWNNPPLAADVAKQYRQLASSNSYDSTLHVLPHGSYLVNLAQTDADKAAQAYTSFVDDLKRCDELGIRLYNFHPGNCLGGDKAEACARIAERLNKAHAETKQVVTVLENMAGGGNVVGGRFEELRDIIEGVKDKKRVAVCLDTCHAFAAGYDLRTPEAYKKTMEEFDEVVGLKYLKAFHINDSKAPLGSNRDLHANIGTGFLGLGAFHNLVNDETFAGTPMILETPIERKGPDGKTFEDKQVWADEIKLLEWLVGADRESEEFKEKEAKLWKQGEGERAKLQDQVDRKAAKDAKKGVKKGKGRGRKKVKEETDDDESE